MKSSDYYVLDYEIRQYMEELECSIDCFGISYIPERYLLFRLNSINDIIVNKCKTYNEASKNEMFMMMGNRYRDINVRPMQCKNETKNKLNIKTLKECPLVLSSTTTTKSKTLDNIILRHFDIKKSTLYNEKDNVSIYKNEKKRKSFIMHDCIPRYLSYHYTLGEERCKLSTRFLEKNENMCFNYLCEYLKIKIKNEMKWLNVMLSMSRNNHHHQLSIDDENHLSVEEESFAKELLKNENIMLNSSTLWEIHQRGFMLNCAKKENDEFFMQVAGINDFFKILINHKY